jgi:hypothetical protein
VSLANATTIGANEFAVASSSPYQAFTGTHFHSDDGLAFGNPPDEAEVGDFADNEEVRGMGEFDLTGQSSASVVTLTFRVGLLGGLFGQSPSTFDVEVVTYDGNDVEDIGDFEAPATSTVGMFSTAGLMVGDVLTFDVTAAFNAAVGGGIPALGVRIQATTDPGTGAVTFEDFELSIPDLAEQCRPVPTFCPPANMDGVIQCVAGVPCHGTQGPDVLCGSAGDDEIYGHGGRDIICAGPGNDRAGGGQGHDQIDGARGCQPLTGSGEDDDRIYGQGGADILVGGDGDDRIVSGTGDDLVLGEGGDDELRSSSGADLLVGGAGDDSARAGRGPRDTCDAEDERGCEFDCRATAECGDGALDPGEECEQASDCGPGFACEMCQCVGTGDVRVTLSWGDTNDLDLHVIDPSGAEIFYASPTSSSGGMLDVDANPGCNSPTTTPVENIFWPAGAAPIGAYTVLVNFFEACPGGAATPAYTVKTVVDGVETTFNGSATTPDSSCGQCAPVTSCVCQTVITFTR